jgi:putative transposase
VADPAVLVGVISDQRTGHNIPHTVACRALGVSQAWFYKWRRRPAEPTPRQVRRAGLEERITYFFHRSGDTYGSPRVTLDLWAEGWQVSVNTVAEIMAGLGLQGRKPPRRRRSLTARASAERPLTWWSVVVSMPFRPMCCGWAT